MYQNGEKGTYNRAISLNSDSSILAPLRDVRSAKPRVQLDLVDTQDASLSLSTPLLLQLLDVSLQLIQVVHTIITDAQRADLSSLLSLDQSLPGSLACF